MSLEDVYTLMHICCGFSQKMYHNMQVTSPTGSLVYSMKGTSGDKFQFKAAIHGIYKFCFQNPASTPETVSFYIHVGHIPNEHDLAKDGQ